MVVTVDNHPGPSDKSDLAVTQAIEVLEGLLGADFVVRGDPTQSIGLRLPAQNYGRDFSALQDAKKLGLKRERVGENDQPFDASCQQNIEVFLKAYAVVLDVHQKWKITRSRKAGFDSAQNLGAIWICDVRYHHADGMALMIPQSLRERIGFVAQSFRNVDDALLG